jgi:hypothetical protein
MSGRATRQSTVATALLTYESHHTCLAPPLCEFDTCPDWVPGLHRCWLSAPIILKTLGVDGFDSSANCPAKVRNVSNVGSQIKYNHFLVVEKTAVVIFVAMMFPNIGGGPLLSLNPLPTILEVSGLSSLCLNRPFSGQQKKLVASI